MIQLNELIKHLDVKILNGENKTIREIQLDSRQVNPDDAFVAVQGVHLDGHDFIDKAIDNGAKVIFLEKSPDQFVDGVTYVLMQQGRRDTALIARKFYNHPSARVKLIGVTGTNGKTTVSTLLHNLFTLLGYKCGLISTIEVRIGKEILKATHTTPDPVQLNKLIHNMVMEGCTLVFMEVSSHAIHQERIAGLEFQGRIFTNISHDHLDYHGDFKSYINAKKKFFDDAQKGSFTLINSDDRNGRVMIQNSSARNKTYGLTSPTDYRAKIIENDFNGLYLLIDNREVHFKLIGKFNAYNLLAVYGVAMELEENPVEVLKILSELDGAEGRFDVIVNKSKVTAIVDYAHTPDALENVITTIDSMLQPGQKLITVIGCGGDRDKSKRPLMAEIACRYSNQVVLTSDNPRTEVPHKIIDDMMEGVPVGKLSAVLNIENRASAIKTACTIASPGDIILVAGKGHETYQEIMGVKHPFDDKKVLKEVLFVL